MMFQLCTLASGSKGNCIFLSDGQTKILIDAGLSVKEIAARLAKLGENPQDIDGILLSHIHSDHARGVDDFCRKYQKEVFCNRNCGREFLRANPYESGKPFRLGGLEIEPVALPHDTPTCDGFLIRSGKTSAAVVTDLGICPGDVSLRLRDLDVLVVECNHDLGMLARSRYPYPLRSRIRSDRGHLSNAACAELIERVYSERLSDVYLAHLSEENNTPELAYYTVTGYLKDKIDLHKCRIHVSLQSQISEVYRREEE